MNDLIGFALNDINIFDHSPIYVKYKTFGKTIKGEYTAWTKTDFHVGGSINGTIEYNPIDDGEFQQASEESINAYIKALENAGIVVKVRRSRGKDIDAACGQLADKEA